MVWPDDRKARSAASLIGRIIGGSDAAVNPWGLAIRQQEEGQPLFPCTPSAGTFSEGSAAPGRYNAVTVAWGSFGVMWHRPFAQVVVRPTRYTFDFREKGRDFTLSVFPERHRDALELLGTRSGRDGDKIQASGLTPIASTRVTAPGFAEAELILECRKIYSQDLDPARFLDPAIDANYPKKDDHRVYFGEILAALGVPEYAAGT
jgi:flavin reductase (DIM6/NTAB) family NADH-FMN oxidoreductase RutF